MHWCLKLMMGRYLLVAGFREKDIRFEKRVGSRVADLFAEKSGVQVWVECGQFTEDRLSEIREFYSGILIQAIPARWFERQLDTILGDLRAQRTRIDWRDVHRRLVPRGCAIWAIEMVDTAPKVLWGVARSTHDRFAFVAGWSVSHLRPRKTDAIVDLYDSPKAVWQALTACQA